MNLILNVTPLRDFMEVTQEGHALVVCDPNLMGRGISNQFTTQNIAQFQGETPQYSRRLREAGYVFIGMSDHEFMQDHVLGESPDPPCPVFGDLDTI